LTKTIEEYLDWELIGHRRAQLFRKYKEESPIDVIDIAESDLAKEKLDAQTSQLFYILNLIPHYVKTRDKWVVMLKFKEFTDVERVYAFFAKIVTATYQSRITPYYAKISKLALPETYPLFNPRVVSYTETQSSYRVEVENAGVYKLGTRTGAPNLEDKKYHLIEDVNDCTVELSKDKDARHLYVFEVEKFDNYGVSELNSKDLGPKALDKIVKEGVVSFLDIKDLRIINVNQFEI